jgi:hypothetical protein
MMNTVTRSGQLAILPLCSLSEPRPYLGTEVSWTPTWDSRSRLLRVALAIFDDGSAGRLEG